MRDRSPAVFPGADRDVEDTSVVPREPDCRWPFRGGAGDPHLAGRGRDGGSGVTSIRRADGCDQLLAIAAVGDGAPV